MVGWRRMGLLIAEDGVSIPAAVLGVCTFTVTAGVFVLLYNMEGDWSKWQQATCLETELGCFCEKPRDTLVRQPVNTFTNLAFSVVGVVVLMETIQQQINLKRKLNETERLGQAFACLYAISQIILGAGSGWYHASLSFWGQWIDNAAMYLTVTAPALYALSSIRLAQGTKNMVTRYVAEWLTVNIFLGLLVLYVPSTRRWVFVALILAMLLAEVYARVRMPNRAKVAKLSTLACAFVSFAVAFFIWTMDIKHIWCWPESVIQGHGIWHILDGFAAFFIFMYYHPCAFSSLPLSKKDLTQ